MNYRKIILWSSLGFIAFVMLIIQILQNHFFALSVILGLLIILGIIAIMIAVGFGYGKDIYQISGAVVAWTAFLLIWLFWNPISFKFAIEGGSFWAIQAFVFIGLILLGRTGAFVFFVRAITTIMILFSFWALISSFTEKGAKTKADTQDNMNRTMILGQIIETETSDKERRARPIKKIVNELREKVKNKNLSEADRQSLQKAKTDIMKIYLPPTPVRSQTKAVIVTKQKRHLSGIFKLPADGSIVEKDIEGKILKYVEGQRIYLKQLGVSGKYLFINNDDVVKDIIINTPTYNTARAVGDGIIRLKPLDGKERMVKVIID